MTNTLYIKLTSILLLTASFYFNPLIAQTNSSTGYVFWNVEMQSIAKPFSSQTLLDFKDNVISNTSNLFIDYPNAFGLSPNESMVLENTKIVNGVTHYKFQHRYNGYPVYGSQMRLHDRPAGLSANGGLVQLDFVNTNINTSIVQAETNLVNFLVSELNDNTVGSHFSLEDIDTIIYSDTGFIESYELESGQNSVYLELNNLSSGMYVLSIKIYEEIYASTNLIVIN